MELDELLYLEYAKIRRVMHVIKSIIPDHCWRADVLCEQGTSLLLGAAILGPTGAPEQRLITSAEYKIGSSLYSALHTYQATGQSLSYASSLAPVEVMHVTQLDARVLALYAPEQPYTGADADEAQVIACAERIPGSGFEPPELLITLSDGRMLGVALECLCGHTDDLLAFGSIAEGLAHLGLKRHWDVFLRGATPMYRPSQRRLEWLRVFNAAQALLRLAGRSA